MKFLLCTPTGEMNNMIREIFIYACILEFKITVSDHIYMLFCFPTKLARVFHPCRFRRSRQGHPSLIKTNTALGVLLM